ncbi:DNA methyltransferase family protein [Paenibacillus sonchi]|uniref:hypothetical protein n=1 Tax=Paenibacillus sonchi TaxID=373687 RepID=UPI001E36575C|nr:hypothetical protein [Paenibacillus sonchi]MCE3198776.1 hypothetical protein [Paenibacillus sonchi]
MTEETTRLSKEIRDMIDIVYSGTNNALAVADQLTFFWSVFLLAADGPISLKYPYKMRTSYTWGELVDAEDDAYEVIQIKVLPELLKGHPGYLPKRMASGGLKLTVTETQCYSLITIIDSIYKKLDGVPAFRTSLLALYDYMLDILFKGSIEGEDEWMSGESVDFIVSLVDSHLRVEGRGDSIHIHDAHCRSGQLLTASYRELPFIDPRKSLISGRSLSPIMTRISTFRFLLSGIHRFSVLNRDPLVYPSRSFSKATRKDIADRMDVNEIVYILPPRSITYDSRELSDPGLIEQSDHAGVELSYLLYGLNSCAPGGWAFAVLPDELLKTEGGSILEKIETMAQIHSIVRLPKESSRMNIGKNSSLVVILKEPLGIRQQLDDIRRYELSGYRKDDIKLFFTEYEQKAGQTSGSNLTGFIEVRKPKQIKAEIEEKLLERISKFEGQLSNLKDSLSIEQKLFSWQTDLYDLGSKQGIALAWQHLIHDNRINAVLSKEGEVVYELNQTGEKRDGYVSIELSGILSPQQWQLYIAISLSESPIAIHKARQRLSMEDRSVFTIQQAVETVQMLARMGMVECIYESVNRGAASPADNEWIDLWMRVPEGGRQWKFTASR